MTPIFEKALVGFLTAAVLGLSGWVYSTGNRVSAVEATQTSIQDSVQVIREDVREIRKALLGG